MKNIKQCAIVALCTLMMLFIPLRSNAYVPGDNTVLTPKITNFVFEEQGKLLKYGDSLHIRFKLENAPPSFVIMTFSMPMSSIIIQCAYSIDSGCYVGVSDPLDSYDREGVYTGSTKTTQIITALNGEPMEIKLPTDLSFIFCNDCYYGRHRGGKATPSKQAICSICETPYGGYAKGVKLNATKTTLQAGKTSTALKIEEKNPSDKVKKWTSSNPKVVSVNKKTGKLTAKKTGKATITLTMKSGATAKCKVTVKKSADKTKKLIIGKVPKLKVGQKYQLIVKRDPITAKEKLTYESNESNYVSVNKKGVLKAKRTGSCIITVKSSNGKKAKFRVGVG